MKRVQNQVWKVGLLTALCCCAQTTALASHGPSSESRYLARHGMMPYQTRYLYPGGDLSLSAHCLSRTEERMMVLTFDDGPHKRDLAISALLKERRIPATFFYVGERARTMPEIVQKMVAEHHEIGYHADRHQEMSLLSHTRLEKGFLLGVDWIKHAGAPIHWFRPPYGDFNDTVVQTAQTHGLQTILWTIDSKDWSGIDTSTVTKRVIQQFHPGAIILFHSTRAASLDALPAILEAADKARYRFVSLDMWRQINQAAQCNQSEGNGSNIQGKRGNGQSMLQNHSQ